MGDHSSLFFLGGEHGLEVGQDALEALVVVLELVGFDVVDYGAVLKLDVEGQLSVLAVVVAQNFLHLDYIGQPVELVEIAWAHRLLLFLFLLHLGVTLDHDSVMVLHRLGILFNIFFASVVDDDLVKQYSVRAHEALLRHPGGLLDSVTLPLDLVLYPAPQDLSLANNALNSIITRLGTRLILRKMIIHAMTNSTLFVTFYPILCS